MEDFRLVRCDSLDAGSDCGKDVMIPMDCMTFEPESADLTVTPEPSAAELAQCEVELNALLSIIAELNKKMGSVKAPSEQSAPCRPLVPDLLSHRLIRRSPERRTAVSPTYTPVLTNQGGSNVVWTKLEEVLSAVEDSISCRRSWAEPITASDQAKVKEQQRAAQESWIKATQILDEMEKEFGISCPSGLPKYQDDNLDWDKQEKTHRSTVQNHQEKMERTKSTNRQMEEEKNKMMVLHAAWKSGSCSSSYKPSGNSPAGSLSPDWASPPFPGSPSVLRRRTQAGAPGGDSSLLAAVNSGSQCPSPGSENETERLNRCIERLKVRNERLTAALERRKGESELTSITLNKLEADCSAMQTALRYHEECEEAYSELLSLHEAQKQQSAPLQTLTTERVSNIMQQPDSPADQHRHIGTEEISTSFSAAESAEETHTQSHSEQRTPDLMKREAALRQQIERLKKNRAAICVPKSGPGTDEKLCSDTGGPGLTDNTRFPDNKKERASLFYELISVREEMSDMRALIRFKEKELRSLEWRLMAQKAQDAAGALVPESLREELEDRRNDQRLSESAAKTGSDSDTPGPRTGPLLKELQVILQREQALKRRLALVQDSLNMALSDVASHRRDSGEQIARLTQAHRP
ncbi:uncharacterized protein ushbp1 isoform X2 [Thalassophryne amazonica]|uniref:uncharacterized protein ushbp1 isoform X2 n=1 Tax=Thalassophryne amazonica TaxID=390379 RepID=UPI0014711A97|nr:uncharacterized protein ushbp1 isoform X2 [Thalassophryne amazonica]